MNRPSDVCALCDTPIDMTVSGWSGPHVYLGPGWVHGGGRENIPVHYGCLAAGGWAGADTPRWRAAVAWFRREVLAWRIDGPPPWETP